MSRRLTRTRTRAAAPLPSVIEQTKGISMSHRDVRSDTAFETTRRWAQDTNSDCIASRSTQHPVKTNLHEVPTRPLLAHGHCVNVRRTRDLNRWTGSVRAGVPDPSSADRTGRGPTSPSDDSLLGHRAAPMPNAPTGRDVWTSASGIFTSRSSSAPRRPGGHRWYAKSGASSETKGGVLRWRRATHRPIPTRCWRSRAGLDGARSPIHGEC